MFALLSDTLPAAHGSGREERIFQLRQNMLCHIHTIRKCYPGTKAYPTAYYSVQEYEEGFYLVLMNKPALIFWNKNGVYVCTVRTYI